MSSKKKIITIVLAFCLCCLFVAPSFAAGLVKQSGNLSNPKTWCDSAERGNFGDAVELGDLDNDGFDDLLVAASGTSFRNEYAYLFYSRGNGNFESPIELDIGRPTGLAMGDVNDDGIKDAIVVSSYGHICAFYGSTTRFSSTLSCGEADWAYYDANPFGSGGPSGIDIADLNADGIDDIVIGAPNQDRMIAFYGSASGLPADLSPDVDIEGDTGLNSSQGGLNYRVGGQMGAAVAKDGNYCDATAPTDPCGSQFVAGVPYAAIDLDGNGVVASGETNIGVALVGPRWQFLSGDNKSYSYFGYELGHAGDVNGDGETDLIVSSKATSTTSPKSFVYLGKSEGFAKMDLDYSWAVEETGDRECLDSANITCKTFGAAVGSAGDINGDGYSDIFISDYRYDLRGGRPQTDLGYWGRAYIWYGGSPSVGDPTGLGMNPTPSSADITISGTGSSGGFGESYATGDINGDGYSDIVVGDPRGADFCIDPDTSQQVFAEVGLVWVYLSDFSPNLKLTKTASPNPAAFGEQLTYTLLIRNDGNSDATGVVLTDQLPTGVGFNSVSASQGGCSGPNALREISCGLGTIAAKASTTVTIEVTPTVLGNIVNTALVTENEVDFNVFDNEISLNTNVVKYVDLAVTKSALPDPVFVGRQLSYTINVFNNSSNDSSEVTLDDQLPESVNFLSVDSSQGSCGTPDGMNLLSCDLGVILGGGSATITIVVIPQASGLISNSVSVSSAENDSNNLNNNTSISTTVNEPVSDLAVTKSANPDPIYVGNVLTYQLIMTNKGPQTATNVVLTDFLPGSVSHVSTKTTQGVCTLPDPISKRFNCQVGELSDGGSATITVQVVPESPGVILNSATVFSSESDPNQSNNSVSVSVTVNDANTPPGPGVEVDSGKDVTLTFDNVTEAGDTTVTTSNDNPAPDEPNFDLRGTYYDIQTTAVFEGEVELCFSYDDTGMTLEQELALRIYHLVDGVWQRIDLTSFDFVNNVICGKVASFSWFAVGMVKDTDNDGIADDIDNCLLVGNGRQIDSDMDGYGNMCDADLDQSGFVNIKDLALFKQVFGTTDPNSDFDSSGFVNIKDLATLKSLFGKPPGPSALAP